MVELKADKRARKREKKRLGQTGTGASHTREASIAEVEGHIRKIKNTNKRKVVR